MAEWQPIDTAPMGMSVQLWGESAGEISGQSGVEGYLGSGFYSDRGDYVDEGFYWELDGGDYYTIWAKPTHWMPLPEPPKQYKE